MAIDPLLEGIISISIQDLTPGRMDAIIGQFQAKMAELGNIPGAQVGQQIFGSVEGGAKATLAVIDQLKVAINEMNAAGRGMLAGGAAGDNPQVIQLRETVIATDAVIAKLKQLMVVQQEQQLSAVKAGQVQAEAMAVAATPVVPLVSPQQQKTAAFREQYPFGIADPTDQYRSAYYGQGSQSPSDAEINRRYRQSEWNKPIPAGSDAGYRPYVPPDTGYGPMGRGGDATAEMAAARAAASEVTGTATALSKAQADNAAADIGVAKATQNLEKSEIDAEVRIQGLLKAWSTSMGAQLRLEKAMGTEAAALEKAAAQTPVVANLSGINTGASARVQQLQLDLAINVAKEQTLAAAGKGANTEVALAQARIKTLAVQERLTVAMEEQAAGASGGGGRGGWGGGMGGLQMLKYYAFFQAFTEGSKLIKEVKTATEEYSLAVNQLSIALGVNHEQASQVAEQYSRVGQTLATAPTIALEAATKYTRFFQDTSGASGQVGAQLGSTVNILEGAKASGAFGDPAARAQANDKTLGELAAIAKNYDLGAQGAADLYDAATVIAQSYGLGESQGGKLTAGTAQIADLLKQSGFNPEQGTALVGSVMQYTGNTSEMAAGDLKRFLGRQGSDAFKNIFAEFNIDQNQTLREELVALGTKFDKLSETQRAKIVSVLGGGRAGAAVMAAITDLPSQTAVAAKGADSVGIAFEQAQLRLGTFAGKLEQISADWSTLAKDIGTSGLGNLFAGIFNEIDPLLRGIDFLVVGFSKLPDPIKDVAEAVLLLSVAGRTLGGSWGLAGAAAAVNRMGGVTAGAATAAAPVVGSILPAAAGAGAAAAPVMLLAGGGTAAAGDVEKVAAASAALKSSRLAETAAIGVQTAATAAAARTTGASAAVRLRAESAIWEANSAVTESGLTAAAAQNALAVAEARTGVTAAVAAETQAAATGTTLVGSLKSLGSGFVALTARILPVAAALAGVMALGAVWDSFNTTKTGVDGAVTAYEDRKKALASGLPEDYRAAASGADIAKANLQKSTEGVGGALLYKVAAQLEERPLWQRAALTVMNPMSLPFGQAIGSNQRSNVDLQNEMQKLSNQSRIDAARVAIQTDVRVGNVADPLALENRKDLPTPELLAKALGLGDPKIKGSRVAALNKMSEADLAKALGIGSDSLANMQEKATELTPTQQYFAPNYGNIDQGMSRLKTMHASVQTSVKMLTDELKNVPADALGDLFNPETGMTGLGDEVKRLLPLAQRTQDPTAKEALLRRIAGVTQIGAAAAAGTVNEDSANETNDTAIQAANQSTVANVQAKVASIKAMSGLMGDSQTRIRAIATAGLRDVAQTGDVNSTVALVNTMDKAFIIAFNANINAEAAILRDQLAALQAASGAAANAAIAATDDPRRQSIIANRSIGDTPAQAALRLKISNDEKILSTMKAGASSFAPTGGATGPTAEQIEEARLGSLATPGSALSAASAQLGVAQYKLANSKDQAEYWNNLKGLHDAQFAYSQAQLAGTNAAVMAGATSGDPISQAAATLAAAGNTLRSAVGGTERSAAQKSYNDAQLAYSQAVRASVEAQIGASVIPGDPISAATAALRVAQSQLSNAVGSTAYYNALKGLHEAQYALAQAQMAAANAQISASAISGDPLSAAAAALHVARNVLSQAVGSTAYWTAVKGLSDAQVAYAQAQMAYANDLANLRIDMTDPLAVAREKVTEAANQLNYDRGRGAASATAKDQVAYQQAKSAAEKTAFDQQFSDQSTNYNLQRESLSAYLSYLNAQHNYLTAVHGKTRQQVDELNQVDQALKGLADQMQGQFNLGQIKVPTVYEARAGMGLSTTNNVTITINGTDIPAVTSLLTQYVGQAAMSTSGSTARKV